MQFLDGNRIDLSICDLEKLDDSIAGDSLTKVLLDKDGRVRNLPPASELDYLPKKPTRKQFDDCCNEFWWLNPYVAKGLWRGELIYAKFHLDCLMRNELMKMLEWYFGVKTGYAKAMGKQGKHIGAVLEKSEWQMLQATYSDADFNHIWKALLGMGELFRKVSQEVAQNFGFWYPEDDDQKVSQFIQTIRDLPADAASFD